MSDALIAFLGVALGAAAAALVTFVTTRQQLEQSRKLTIRAERAAVYVEVLAYLWHGKLMSSKISPHFGTEPDPLPETPKDEEMTGMLARLDAFGAA